MPLATSVKLDITQEKVDQVERLVERSNKVSRDVLTVQTGKSVTIFCENHDKYGGVLEWGVLPDPKDLPPNSLIEDH